MVTDQSPSSGIHLSQHSSPVTAGHRIHRPVLLVCFSVEVSAAAGSHRSSSGWSHPSMLKSRAQGGSSVYFPLPCSALRSLSLLSFWAPIVILDSCWVLGTHFSLFSLTYVSIWTSNLSEAISLMLITLLSSQKSLVTLSQLYYVHTYLSLSNFLQGRYYSCI